MKLFLNPSPSFPLSPSNPNDFRLKLLRPICASVRPPPPDFDFRSEIASESRAAIAVAFPELLDLADNGTLVLVEKRRFGPVPAWRKDFVEPEAIWLVGTDHISPESAADVERVVRTVKPDNVVVELCRSRAGIMYTSSVGEVDQNMRSGMFSLTGTGFLGAVGRSLNLGKKRVRSMSCFSITISESFSGSLGGETALALRLLLALFSSKLSSDSGRPFGDEFRAARKASEEVGAQLVLGDRPIEITLQRAWNSLKWSEKLNLVAAVTRGIASSSNLSQTELKRTEESNSSFQLYERLSFSYPSLLQPLIHERDTYIAWSLKRSKAVNRSKKVVGVIGKGHLNGVIYALETDLGDLRFRDLVGRNTSDDDGWLQRAAKSLARDTVLGFLLWELYQLYIRFMTSQNPP
ncbi:PREDICTED: traB domain-containing protein isoform X2 [Tarenaya hassleriana]|uniref:traB domain-containing protein isoform X2 n=1 Tax=Tarenaya hassleriana TaxID=28532 RepID=UPI00053C68BB|nr:PREDICTED: traB domain-containing protein isoform X2 [Tarenaya hassleriana]